MADTGQSPAGRAPVVSVVMPLFNKERQVARAVQSVLDQTCSEFELIIVNDGSTDESRGVVASIKDHRIRVIDQKNAGVSAARNRSIGEARADLIAFCDADDEWEPDHLESLLHLARTYPEAAVFATGYFIAGHSGSRRVNILRGLPVNFEEGYLDDYFRVAAGSDPPLHTSSVAARVGSLRAVGFFPVGADLGEDLITWARLAVNNRIAYLRRPTATFREAPSVWDRPGRAPAPQDLVGDDLARMFLEAPAAMRTGLAAYLALWHRMRGVICLKRDDRRRARAEFRQSRNWGGRSLKIGVLRMFCFVPRAGRVFEALERGRNRLRGARR